MTGTQLAASAASGLLLALSRPPFDAWPLALVALLPLLWVWLDDAPGAAALHGFVAGVAYYGVLVSWSWYFGAVAIVPFVSVLACSFAAIGAATAWLRRAGLASAWTTAAVWVSAEALLARWPLGGFSWGEVGVSFHDLEVARALASVGGVPLVGFLAVAGQAGASARLRGGSRPSAVSRVSALLLVAGLAAALALRPTTDPTGELRVALVQGNDLNRDLTPAEVAERYLPRSHFELAEGLEAPLDLVVFPESSMDADPRRDAYLEAELRAAAERLDAWVLANATADAPDGRALNLNVLYAPDGRLVGTYAKRHLVPFGEYIPFRSALDWIPALDQVPRDYAPGTRAGLFNVGGHRVATVICFESAFAADVRPLVREGAEVVVVTTNNRSYRRSGNSAQHLALSQMRAAETGRPVLHASISGITAVIDADGTLRHTTDLFDRTVVTTTVTGREGQTLYVRHGDWVVVASLAALGAATLAALVRRRRRSVDSAPGSGGPPPGGPHAEATGERA